jgi:hypothetical protein
MFFGVAADKKAPSRVERRCNNATLLGFFLTFSVFTNSLPLFRLPLESCNTVQSVLLLGILNSPQF